MKIASIGEGGAAALAADLALAGHDVSVAAFPPNGTLFDAARDAGGIDLSGEPSATLAGRSGRAIVRFADIPSALSEAELVIVEFAPDTVEAGFAALAPHLRAGQVVHANTHGYWPALRGWTALRAHGRTDVTITESIAPIGTALLDGATARALVVRPRLPVAAFPAGRAEGALDVVRQAVPTIVPARNVIETGFANLNMLVHPGIALVNLGWFDRAAEAGETASFYGAGNTASASLLTEALDRERQAACAAYGVAWRPVTSYLADFYQTEGATFRDAVRNCRFYAAIPDHAPDLGVSWVRLDLPYAHAPLVALAALAGVPLPLQSGLLAIFGAVLGEGPAPLGLDPLGLAGADLAAVRRYVETGAF